MTDQPQPEKPPIKQDEAKPEGAEKKSAASTEPVQKSADPHSPPSNSDGQARPVSTEPTGKTAQPTVPPAGGAAASAAQPGEAAGAAPSNAPQSGGAAAASSAQPGGAAGAAAANAAQPGEAAGAAPSNAPQSGGAAAASSAQPGGAAGAAPSNAPQSGGAATAGSAQSGGAVSKANESDAPVSKPKIDTAPLKDAAEISGTRDLRDIAKDITVPSKGTLSDREGRKDDSGPLPKVAQRFPESGPEGATQSAMQICPTCGHRNRPGVLICDNCGTNLMTGSKAAIGTRDLVREQEEKEAAKPGDRVLDTAQMKAVESAGGTVFSEDMVLRIEIEGGTTPMMVYPKQEIIMGRRDPNTGGLPDVDLTSYAGYRMGVSRHHAAIRLQDKQLNVSDLGSSNGTFLNGTRLTAHRPYQVRDGDEIRLGQMVLRVYFQNAKDKK